MVAVPKVQPEMLADGVYTRSQAAYLARLRPQTVNRWFDGTDAGKPPLRMHMPQNEHRLVSYVDLFQLMALREIRLVKKISLQRVRAAVATAEEMGVVYPLARDVELSILGDDLIITLPNGSSVGLTGRIRHQHVMGVILPYLDKVTWNEQGLPQQFRPTQGILLDPQRFWGAPLVEAAGYTVATLVQAARTEGSIKAAAKACEVDESAIRQALDYDDRLAGIAA